MDHNVALTSKIGVDDSGEAISMRVMNLSFHRYDMIHVNVVDLQYNDRGEMISKDARKQTENLPEFVRCSCKRVCLGARKPHSTLGQRGFPEAKACGKVWSKLWLD